MSSRGKSNLRLAYRPDTDDCPGGEMILLNTPHDPAGKAFTRKETETIAGVLKGFNLLAVADEVV